MWDGFLRLHEAIRSRYLHLTVVGENPRRRKRQPSTQGCARADRGAERTSSHCHLARRCRRAMNATTLATRAAPRHPPDQRDSAPRWVGSDQRGWAVHSSGSRLAARIVPRLFHHAPSVPCGAQRAERDREGKPLVDGPAESGCPQAQHLGLLRLSPAVLTRPHPDRSTMRRTGRLRPPRCRSATRPSPLVPRSRRGASGRGCRRVCARANGPHGSHCASPSCRSGRTPSNYKRPLHSGAPCGVPPLPRSQE